MRERIANGVVLLTLAVILGLSGLFANRHNQPPADPQPAAAAVAPPPAPPKSDVTAAVLERGRKVFAEQRCTACHAIGSEGNPRAPLDGVGAHLTPEELKMWILGSGSAAELLSPAVQRRKQRYQSIPETDLSALVAYLTTLKQPSP